MLSFSCIVPMKELAGEASTHDIIHDKKHEMTQEGMLEDMLTSCSDNDFCLLGIMTESPPLKNLL